MAFLKNVLVRTPEYRRALAAISTPRDEIGEPITRFLALKAPVPESAPPDESLAFTLSPAAGAETQDASFVGAAWLNGEGAAGVGRRPSAASSAWASVSARLPEAGVAAVLAADLNYDFRTDFVLAGAGGVRLLRQQEDGSLSDVTAEAKLPAAVAPASGAWAADVDTDGDLDVVVGAARGPAAAACATTATARFAARTTFGRRDAACATSSGRTSTAKAFPTRRCSMPRAASTCS